MPRPQFTLRALLVAMLVASVAAAFAHNDHRAKVARALADVNRCEVRFREEWKQLDGRNNCGPYKMIEQAQRDLLDAEHHLKDIRGFMDEIERRLKRIGDKP
jgi:hypothetical protein